MKAIALISGGLDSVLAAKLVQSQGVEVDCIHFQIPFCHRPKESNKTVKSAVKLAEDNLGKPAEEIDIKHEFLEMLLNPKHGYGSNINPCIDCKILMLKKAAELMRVRGASFIITGEVLGQRPMSQNMRSLQAIEKESGLKGLLLRPLSAALLEETIPEREGWVDRSRLMNINGRSRGGQFGLAEKFGVDGYSWPAGGCLLTDPIFSRRLADLIEHCQVSQENIELLKYGRHFRLRGNLKVVIGRNEKENIELERLRFGEDYFLTPCGELAGPAVLARGKVSLEDISYICKMAASYCDLALFQEARIEVFYPSGAKEVLSVVPFEREVFRGFLL